MGEEINYSLGLDIGIASVGWSVINLDVNRIEDLGVRIFNAAENPKDGASLALPRRSARGRRRLLRRKAYRVKRVKNFIMARKILSEDKLKNLFINKNVISVWEARVKGLNEKLSEEEWSKILINLCKRRGFKSNRKNEAKNKETGQILSSINNNLEKMKEVNARTVGEFIYNEVKSSKDRYKALRNKFGEYNMCVSRDIIREEIHTLFEKQREFENEFAADELEDEYLAIFDSQRPYSKFEDLEKLVGFCTFEKKKYKRAPKNCISSEEFVLYEGINKLSIMNNGDRRKLTNDERELIVNEAFKKKEIKYTNLRKLLNLKEEDRFLTLTYSIDKDTYKTENTKFISLKGYHEIRKSIEYGVSKMYWQEIKNNRKMLNDIAYVLTLGKTDDDIIKQLKLRNISDTKVIDSLLDISFSKFNNLSIEAIEKILPFMKEGYQYNEACEKAGYNFKALYEGIKSKKLPVIEIDEIVNPVVNRALAQTRKVINSVIDRYGSPIRINIELARDLAKNFKDRKAIEKEQKENRCNIEKIREEIKSLMGKEPTGSEVLKYRLWQQQRGECAYTQQSIYIENLFDHGYCEIDHIIPFSRSFDDSLSNKVLVLGIENQRKSNRTPYEYFGLDEQRWNRFETWVKGSYLNYKKKSNLLKKRLSEEEQREWKTRNLQDTKYICRYIANYINNRLEFKPSESKQKVITINGRATAYLRAKWGLMKVRGNGDKHHALDAAVVAVATQKMVQQISKYSKAHELSSIRNNHEFIDMETGEIVQLEEYKDLLKKILPRPWLGFSEELSMRLSNDPISELKKSPFKSYDEEFIRNTVKPIFVSRVPFRKIGGKLFGETVYSKKHFNKDGYFVKKKKLTELTKEDLNNFYNYGCDKRLYDAIMERMEQFNYNAKKAFEGKFRKPTKNGTEGPMVRSIKIKTKVPFKDGIELQNVEGLVAKEGMVRIDIYEKENKYFVVPVYRYQLAKGIIPKKAVLRNYQEEQWPTMDESYKFKFSIYKNDLIEIKYEKKSGYFGYYDGFNRHTDSLTIQNHDRSEEYEGVGIKLGVVEFNKYQVDVLGNYYKVKAGGKQ
ncbi:type II CRISPR RNA-guided endonuclease Cas9 [Clostridium sp. P21]|uniref:CRISPR-associated endonuclease Cas9 n=1 Tax=Clostridium muellerianum TaxID=2716538 RepID=A0A7Y0EHR6_9CLOT|nr:type II CRISPR RNA-guided endonuclease Cas9 [Clostridium muellerianum]NMM63709.1 type II CRISPR RNA-guided endonuclease Cas9 [Clostridium muellerianum]